MAKRKDDDEDGDDVAAKPRSDAYVGLLVITLLAVIGGCVLMHLDHEDLSAGTVPATAASGFPAGLEYRTPGVPN